MVKARKYVVKKHFQGLSKREDFEIVESDLPPLKDREILVKAEWISVDPYLRAYNIRNPVPYDQFGYQIGLVIDSKSSKYPIGCRVLTHKGWCDHCIIEENDTWEGRRLSLFKLPDMQGLPTELAISAVGAPGITAYFGLLEICQPKVGETVVVTGAAGAVGSIVGQIAKIKGCKVIGFAGSDDKVKCLEKELGFDKAFNYKTVDVNAALRQAAPNGIDCYFDNVGGEISSIIISQMNEFGRVSVCGSISTYNEDPKRMPKATILQPSLVFKQIKIEGFIVHRWAKPEEKWFSAMKQMIQWIISGQIKYKNHVTIGFDKIYDAFVGMLNGENTGKAVVQIINN